MTRIMAVIVVALVVEVLVNEAKFSVLEPSLLWQPALVGVSVAFLLIGWGAYIKLSRSQ